MATTKTHFEQVPVEAVKKVGGADIPQRRVKTRNRALNPSPEKNATTQPKDAPAGQEGSPKMKPPSEPEYLYPEWQKPYLAALVADTAEMQERVTAAETAIFNRLQSISKSFDDEAERQALSDALRSLRMLKKTKLAYPDWEKDS